MESRSQAGAAVRGAQLDRVRPGCGERLVVTEQPSMRKAHAVLPASARLHDENPQRAELNVLVREGTLSCSVSEVTSGATSRGMFRQ